jgi:dihydroneopterin aldolase/2-amino-4-hydroxy-6-hydroxymethyldihydropteridine diphosphokinase
VTREHTGTEIEMPDRISLVGLAATGYHGVLPEERRAGQLFRADVVVHVDTRPAAESDDLTHTVNYATLARDVVDVLAGDPVDLIETLAQRIADVALAVPRVEAVDVVVHKPEAPVGVPFDDVRVSIHRRRRPHPDPLDRRPEGEADVVLALGGNIGDVRDTLREAIADLDAAPGLSVGRVSPLARTAAVGPPQDDYLNAVALARTTLSPRELLTLTRSVEDAHGRRRTVRWGPRTLDVDIVVFDGVTSADPELELPHPRARERAFVLLPWAVVDPAAVLSGPGGGPVAALAEQAPDREDVRWVAEEGWHQAGSGA